MKQQRVDDINIATETVMNPTFIQTSHANVAEEIHLKLEKCWGWYFYQFPCHNFKN